MNKAFANLAESRSVQSSYRPVIITEMHMKCSLVHQTLQADLLVHTNATYLEGRKISLYKHSHEQIDYDWTLF